MKIMFVLNSNIYSGAEEVNRSIIEYFSGKHEMLWASRKGLINTRLKEEKIKFVEIDKMSISEIKRIAKEYKPDILHATDYRASVICSLANPEAIIISHLHNNCPWLRRVNVNSILYLYASKKFKKILTVSDSIENEYIFSRYIKNKIKNISNPVSRNKILAKVGDNQEKKYDVCFIGRLTHQKNPIGFIEIISEIKKSYRGVRAVMVGDGDLKGKCRKLINDLGLVDNISLIGFQENPFLYMNCSKVLCMPSVWEGYGLVAFEALTLGLPCFVSPIGGLLDIVDNSCGHFCANCKEFVEKITEVLNNEFFYQKLSENAIKKSIKLDNIDEYMKKISDIYVDVTTADTRGDVSRENVKNRKVGVVSLNDNTNYGNRLQHYALIAAIRKEKAISKSVDIRNILNVFLSRFIKPIIRPAWYRMREAKRVVIEPFTNEWIPTEQVCSGYKLSNLYDLFIVGSDQVWNPNYTFFNPAYFLVFAQKKKRISYAASFGVSTVPEKRKARFTKHLNGMDIISVRERAGANIIKELTGRIVPVMPDPVFLLTRTEWDELISKNNAEVKSKPYIVVYILGLLDQSVKRNIEIFAQKHNYEIYDIMGNDYDVTLKIPTVPKYISRIKSAEVVFTDSFHACAFSIIFHTPFIVFNRQDQKMSSRLDTILETYKLQKQFASPDANIEDLVKNVKFTHVDAIWGKERDRGINFIREALNYNG